MKSNYGKPARIGYTKAYGEAYDKAFMSEEERILRWKREMGELPELSEEQFNEYINEIRKETKRP